MPALNNKAQGQHTGFYLVNLEGEADSQRIEAPTWQDATAQFLADRTLDLADLDFPVKTKPTEIEVKEFELAHTKWNVARKASRLGLDTDAKGELVPFETTEPKPPTPKFKMTSRKPTFESTEIETKWAEDKKTLHVFLDVGDVDEDDDPSLICVCVLPERG